jgi:uncharacterized protein YbcI
MPTLPGQDGQGQPLVPVGAAAAPDARADRRSGVAAAGEIDRVEPIKEAPVAVASGEDLAAVTNGIVGLFREYYGRGPERAKSYLLDDRYLVCVLGETMTTVERTLAPSDPDLVRRVRLTFQEAMADSFIAVVEEATGRRVLTYHSQLVLDPDLGFEFFLLEER